METAKAERIPVQELISILPSKIYDGTTGDAYADPILAESKKGYGLLFLGLGQGPKAASPNFPSAIEKIVREFDGPVAILLNGAVRKVPSEAILEKILVPAIAADYSRFGAEAAVAIAKGSGAVTTALNISAPPAENELLRRPNQLFRAGRALLRDIVALGEREGVRVLAKVFVGPAKENAILRRATMGGHQLLVQ